MIKRKRNQTIKKANSKIEKRDYRSFKNHFPSNATDLVFLNFGLFMRIQGIAKMFKCDLIFYLFQINGQHELKRFLE